jgi:hypothetical protein
MDLPPGASPIAAEIAERLLEIEDLKQWASIDLLTRLRLVALVSPRLYLGVLAYMSGDSIKIVESYAVQADRRGLTKQALHFEWQRDIARLNEVMPELASALIETKRLADNHEPVGKTGAVEGTY